jgi:carbonic anhydrase
MRNLIALFACCSIALSANANEPGHLRRRQAGGFRLQAASASLPPASAKKQLIELPKKPEPAPAHAAGTGRRRPRRPPQAPKAKKRPKSPCRKRSPSAWPSCASASWRAPAAAREEGRYPAPRRRARRRPAPPLPPSPWPPHPSAARTGPTRANSARPTGRRSTTDWAKCGMGNRQSPIDLRDGIKVNLEQIGFDYHPSSFNEINNGHTIQVTVGGGNFITSATRPTNCSSSTSTVRRKNASTARARRW